MLPALTRRGLARCPQLRSCGFPRAWNAVSGCAPGALLAHTSLQLCVQPMAFPSLRCSVRCGSSVTRRKSSAAKPKAKSTRKASGANLAKATVAGRESFSPTKRIGKNRSLEEEDPDETDEALLLEKEDAGEEEEEGALEEEEAHHYRRRRQGTEEDADMEEEEAIRQSLSEHQEGEAEYEDGYESPPDQATLAPRRARRAKGNEDDLPQDSDVTVVSAAPTLTQGTARAVLQTSKEKKASGDKLGNKLLVEAMPDVAAEYVAAGEANATPVDAVRIGSMRVASWRCATCGEVWRSSVVVRCMTKEGGCPVCAKDRVESVAEKRPDLVPLWDRENNDPFVLPEDCPWKSTKPRHWLCPTCGRSYVAKVKDRVLNKAPCPSCTMADTQSADVLAQEETALIHEWHPLKNGDLRLDRVQPTDRKTKIWWLCSLCGHEWQATLSARLSRRRGANGAVCPVCHGKGIGDL